MEDKMDAPPTTLTELWHAMIANTWDGASWGGAPMAHGKLDWASMPTFGGDEPEDTGGVWSWDKTHLLVGSCADDLEIIARDPA
jgi:hypothetical protein